MINNTYKPLASLSSKPTTYKSMGNLAAPTVGLLPLSSKTAPVAKPMGSVSGTNLASAVSNLNKTIAPVAKPQISQATQAVNNNYQQPVNNSNQSQISSALSNLGNLQTQVNQFAQEQNQPPVKGLFPDILTSLQKKGEEGAAQVKLANDELQRYRLQVGQKEADITGEGSDLNFKTGQLGALQKLATVGENTRQQSVSNALSANNQQITALGTAAGLAAPQVTSFGQTAFNPLTSQFNGGSSNLDPQTTASQLAQKVTSGQMTYDQAASSLGYAGGAGTQFLNNAIRQLNPNFNIPQANATIAGQQDVAKNVVGMQAANNAAKGIENTITGFLASNPDLNPSKLAAGNVINQWIQGKQLTDPKYQTLFNYINEYISTLAPILGVGGDTTNLKTEIAQSFINAQASGASIAQVLKSISSLADQKISNFQSGGLGGNTQNNSGASSGLYNF